MSELDAPLRDTLAALDGLLASIDQQLDDLLTSQPVLKAGVMPLSRLPCLIPEPVIQGKRAASEYLNGGRENCRLLYNCAQATAKTAVWEPYYQALRARKFSATQALVIMARKLLRIAFALWHQADAKFDAQKIGCLKNAA